jgi:hypothetical protein
MIRGGFIRGNNFWLAHAGPAGYVIIRTRMAARDVDLYGPATDTWQELTVVGGGFWTGGGLTHRDRWRGWRTAERQRLH